MNWRDLHLLVGVLGMVMFLLTGQYMARVAGVDALADAQRLAYRSVHIYLLLASVINIATGYFMPGGAVTNLLQRLCCTLLLLSPAALLVSFFTELSDGSLDRPLASNALYLIFLAATLLVAHELWRRFRGSVPE